MAEIAMPGGEHWPALGLGTWRMGEQAGARVREQAAVRLALDIGYRLIDTAEMYGDGGAERVVGQALADALRFGAVRRAEVQVVSKFYPHHAGPPELQAACERSRQRLQLDCIDLYLLHWRGDVPLARTVDGLLELQQRGWIRHWGVSNLDLEDLQELAALPGAAGCAANQVYYSVAERGIELGLLPWQREHGMALMAYCPVGGGTLARDPALATLAREHGLSAAQLALGWVLAQPGVMAIPKAVREPHLRENWAVAQQPLPPVLLQALEALHPRPRRRGPLAMA